MTDAARERSAPVRFTKTKYSQWSAYEMDRRGERHNRVWDNVEEAAKAEPTLKAELDALFSRVHGAAVRPESRPSASVLGSDELEDEMRHAGATLLNSALLEMLAASTGDELPHLWADPDAAEEPAAASSMISVAVTFDATAGDLAISPPSLTFTPYSQTTDAVTDAPECMGCTCDPMAWPLASFVGVNDDPEEHTRCELRLLQGEDDGLLFRFENAINLVTFERTLRVAATSARAAGGSVASTAQPTPTHAAPAAAGSSTPAQKAAEPKRQRTEEPRVRRGRELKEALSKVGSLFAHDKTRQAKDAMAAIPEGPTAKGRTQKERAGELRSLLFTFGGLNLTKAVLERFLGMKEVKLLLDDDFLKTRAEVADAKTATALLQAAKRFLNEMLATKGRRSDVERNAFWASVVSLMPTDLLENRQGRAMMRILGISYSTMKRANTMRKDLEDSNKGNALTLTLTSRPHPRPHPHPQPHPHPHPHPHPARLDPHEDQATL